MTEGRMFSDRMKQVQKWAVENSVDGIALLPGDNFYYVSGCRVEAMERLVALIITPDSGTMVCPKLLEEQCEPAHGVDDSIIWQDSDDPFSLLSDLFLKKRVRTLAIEGSTPYSTFLKLRKGSVRNIVTGDALFSRLRSTKSQEEIDLISAAVSRSEMAYRDTIKQVSTGITEMELAEILEKNFRKRGLSGPAFKSIVAFGENSALPHHEPSDRKLRSGDIVLVDFGGSYGGYASDITRTAAFESMDKEMEKIYRIVRKAQEETISSVNADTTFADIDAIARNIITEAGFGDLFIHRVGHGLGISVHEEPYLVPDNREKIIDGTVFTVEPGIYRRGKGGVRIEDTLYFNGEKAVSFNSLGKDPEII